MVKVSELNYFGVVGVGDVEWFGFAQKKVYISLLLRFEALWWKGNRTNLHRRLGFTVRFKNE
ncbi:MAG: hypothetical protein ACUVXA_15400 [Candidatus Jordarchaeum sp.]|uniref:hypothetical protein n=1 Tax=Candidatus Jordarchaeum sp. TaxID=2823881 RepID=UPI00404ABEC2